MFTTSSISPEQRKEILSQFKHRSPQGLYLYSHFEREDGAFIQVHCRGDHYVYQAADGQRREAGTMGALLLEIAALDA